VTFKAFLALKETCGILSKKERLCKNSLRLGNLGEREKTRAAVTEI
jgi:hypothetical protein